MEKLISRSEVKNEDKWQLEAIYKNIDEFNVDLDKFKKELVKLTELEPNFLKSSKNFKDYFMQDEIVSRLLEKLTIYASCKNDEDKTNSTYQELEGIVTNLYSEYSEKTSKIIPKILQEEKSLITSYLTKEEELKPYKYFFDTIFEKKEHTLSEEVEKVIAMYSPVLGSSGNISSYLTNADLNFGIIKDEQNKEVELSESNYSNYIKSDNREVRKSAFKKLYEAYESVKNTLTATYTTTVNNNSITAKIRNYNSSIEMFLSQRKIPTILYDNLIKVVHNNLSVLYDYYSLKKKVLNLDEYHLYDSYVAMLKDSNKLYSYDDAKNLIINALSIYGDEYKSILEKAFNEGWIDKYPNKGKRSGAYSTGVYDTHPYILLNYTNTYNDVSTLAHELGHSIHSYFTMKNNPYITANYPIFLAEIASTTNELLLSHYMYEHSNSKEEKLTILNEKLDLFKATIFRQTMFAEFEQKAHQYVDSKNVLTCDYLCNLYYELNKEYFGDNVVVDDEIKYEWLRIPHFYTSFYVYQYATSLSIACYVAQNIINKEPGFTEKYLKFLSSGGTNYPLEVLKIIDIDLTDTKIFESAIAEFSKTLEDFKKLYFDK